MRVWQGFSSSELAAARTSVTQVLREVGRERGGLHPVDACLDLVLETEKTALAHDDLDPEEC